MALQGDLESFALPDVLRLLAGTSKSGRLAVEAPPHSGEVWFRGGEIAGGSVTSRPTAASAAEIVYELLQFPEGTFVFADDDQLVDDSPTAAVDGALEEAEALFAEWQEVTKVVPTLDHWVEIAPELATGEVTLDGDQWRLLAVIAGGAPVHTVAERFSESDLDASKRVKAMAEAGLVTVDEPRSVTAPVDDWTGHRSAEVLPDLDEAPAATNVVADGDLVHLSAEEGPVVLETSEDALLPEPLPGEGTSFTAGDLGEDTSSFTVDAPDASLSTLDHDIDPGYEPHGQDIEPVEGTDATAEVGMAWEDLAGTTTGDDEIGTSEEAFQAVGWDENPPVDHLGDGPDSDADRSSLLKFLSGVKH